jgi:hypothetical protein
MLASGDYHLNPEFQRRHRWNTEKKSRLIESFIMNVPIPPIFLYEDKFSHYEVMDGLQRLTAISEFYNDRFPLEGLAEWPDLNGKRYSQLPEQIKRGIDRRYLSSIILLQETAKNPAEAQRLKQLVFERINSGGVQLTPQETRNAIYDGSLNRLCMRLARNPFLCRMWGIPEPTAGELKDPKKISDDVLTSEAYRQMEDVELVLRFFAYRQKLEYQRGALKDYLDLFLRQGNLKPPKLLANYEKLFNATVEVVYEALGETAFFLYRRRGNNWNWLNRPTVVLYDPIMFVFSQHLDERDVLIARKDKLRGSLESFYKSNYEKFEGRNVNRANVTERNQLFESLIQETLASKA